LSGQANWRGPRSLQGQEHITTGIGVLQDGTQAGVAPYGSQVGGHAVKLAIQLCESCRRGFGSFPLREKAASGGVADFSDYGVDPKINVFTIRRSNRASQRAEGPELCTKGPEPISGAAWRVDRTRSPG
jgi:hypothetical protein